VCIHRCRAALGYLKKAQVDMLAHLCSRRLLREPKTRGESSTSSPAAPARLQPVVDDARAPRHTILCGKQEPRCRELCCKAYCILGDWPNAAPAGRCKATTPSSGLCTDAASDARAHVSTRKNVLNLPPASEVAPAPRLLSPSPPAAAKRTSRPSPPPPPGPDPGMDLRSAFVHLKSHRRK